MAHLKNPLGYGGLNVIYHNYSVLLRMYYMFCAFGIIWSFSHFIIP